MLCETSIAPVCVVNDNPVVEAKVPFEVPVIAGDTSEPSVHAELARVKEVAKTFPPVFNT